ncbi:hypothetical protein TQ32_05250 [Pyrococcus kukulkanii]|uniref:Uncharacterized protein n=1 Tax=Pyrococcus kukulkanii TaxID=1609559 RepID=A0A127B9B0_9EURY|nr:hypothetical protein TQ32_05250 [Pyrococcus kukulkanii]
MFSNWIWLASSSSLEVSLPEEVLKMIKKEAKRGRRVLIPVIKKSKYNLLNTLSIFGAGDHFGHPGKTPALS